MLPEVGALLRGEAVGCGHGTSRGLPDESLEGESLQKMGRVRRESMQKKKPSAGEGFRTGRPAYFLALVLAVLRFSHRRMDFIFLRRSRCRALHTRGVPLG